MNGKFVKDATGTITSGAPSCGPFFVSNARQILELVWQEGAIVSSLWSGRSLSLLLDDTASTSAISPSAGYSPRIILTSEEVARVKQIEKNQAVLKLLDSWLSASADYDKQAWPRIKKSVEENRLSDRERFNSDEGSS